MTPSTSAHAPGESSRHLRRGRWIVAASLAIAAYLLFFRLGHYALWDDEAGTALSAKSILLDGDTTVHVDSHNIFAYREGFEVRDLKLRYLPPLPPLFAAGSFALTGETSAFAGRLPFALLGFATIAVILEWVRRLGASSLMLGLTALGLLGNVSLMLYSRQCRYYAASLFFSTVLTLLYLNTPRSRLVPIAFAAGSVLLFATNYLNYVALYVCLGLDYLIYQRKKSPLSWREMLVIVLPQLVICGAIALIWNPLHAASGNEANSLAQRLTLFWWQWRDMNRCEFFPGVLALFAVAVAVWRRDALLARGLLALLVYVACITAVSPQPVGQTDAADVRYLVPLIPLGIGLIVRALVLTGTPHGWLAVSLGLLGFGSNLLHARPLSPDRTRFTLVDYVNELRAPPSDPYAVVARWINAEIPAQKSVWVLPEYKTYPLMFHSPQALYAWQLAWPPQPQFKDLPRIHFKGKEPPDYIIAFGPVVQQLAGVFNDWQKLGVQIEQVATLNHYWRDVHWPEVAWRGFTAVEKFDPNSEAIYIFRRTSPALPAGPK